MSILKRFIGNMPANISALPDKTEENYIKRRLEVCNHENSAKGNSLGNISAKYDIVYLFVVAMNLWHFRAVWSS